MDDNGKFVPVISVFRDARALEILLDRTNFACRAAQGYGDIGLYVEEETGRVVGALLPLDVSVDEIAVVTLGDPKVRWSMESEGVVMCEGAVSTPQSEEYANWRVTTDISGCARCGDTHVELEFIPLGSPCGEFTHWAMCPVRHEPLLLKVTDWFEDPESEDPTGE